MRIANRFGGCESQMNNQMSMQMNLCTNVKCKLVLSFFSI